MIPADDTERMTTLLRPSVPARPSVEDLISRIAELVLARQSLRATGADRDALELNRHALVAAHWDLSHALIERYCDPKPEAAAA